SLTLFSSSSLLSLFLFPSSSSSFLYSLSLHALFRSLVFFVIYFVVFRLLIKMMDLKTIGRETEGAETRLYSKKDYLDKQTNLSRSEEHTSELQSRFDLVCRLLLEK